MPWTRSVHDLWTRTDNADKARERLAEASIIQLTWPTKVPGELELKYLLSALDECDRKFESARTSHVFNRRLFYRRLRNEPHDYGAPQLCASAHFAIAPSLATSMRSTKEGETTNGC